MRPVKLTKHFLVLFAALSFHGAFAADLCAVGEGGSHSGITTQFLCKERQELQIQINQIRHVVSQQAPSSMSDEEFAIFKLKAVGRIEGLQFNVERLEQRLRNPTRRQQIEDAQQPEQQRIYWE